MNKLILEEAGIHRENDPVTAELLKTAERNRKAGSRGYIIDEFERNMREAIHNHLQNPPRITRICKD